MPLHYIGRIELRDNDFLYLRIPSKLIDKYPYIIRFDNYPFQYFQAFWSKVYSDKGKIIEEPGKSVKLKVYRDYNYKDLIIDVNGLVKEKGVTKGYFLEFELLGFILNRGNKTTIIPIFPKELRVEFDYSVPDAIKENVKRKIESLEKISTELETITLLLNIGMDQAAQDMNEALARYRMQDWEGSIKFLRKVTEALRNDQILERLELGLENRKDKLKQLLNKTYSPLSNFGEHAGTKGRAPEAKLAKELTVALVHYIAEYCKRS